MNCGIPKDARYGGTKVGVEGGVRREGLSRTVARKGLGGELILESRPEGGEEVSLVDS